MQIQQDETVHANVRKEEKYEKGAENYKEHIGLDADRCCGTDDDIHYPFGQNI